MNEDDSSSSTTYVYHSDNEDDDSRYTNDTESDVYNDDLDITGPVLQVDTNTSNTDSDDANHVVGLVDVNNNAQEREEADDTMPLIQPVNKRLKGEEHFNRLGQQVAAKNIGPQCNSKFCQKSKVRNCDRFSEEQITQIFHKFWAMMSWRERRAYVQALVDKVLIHVRVYISYV